MFSTRLLGLSVVVLWWNLLARSTGYSFVNEITGRGESERWAPVEIPGRNCHIADHRIGLLLDVSKSFEHNILKAKALMAGVVKKLAQSTASQGHQPRNLYVASFSSLVTSIYRPYHSFYADRIESDIRNLELGRRTCTLDALKAVQTAFDQMRGRGKKVLLIATDGLPNCEKWLPKVRGAFVDESVWPSLTWSERRQYKQDYAKAAALNRQYVWDEAEKMKKEGYTIVVFSVRDDRKPDESKNLAKLGSDFAFLEKSTSLTTSDVAEVEKFYAERVCAKDPSRVVPAYAVEVGQDCQIANHKVALLLDVSTSAYVNVPWAQSIFKGVVKRLGELTRYQGSRPRNLYAASFSDKTHEIYRPYDRFDPEDIEEQINNIPINGSTCTLDALNAVDRAVNQMRGNGEKVLLIVTDGLPQCNDWLPKHNGKPIDEDIYRYVLSPFERTKYRIDRKRALEVNRPYVWDKARQMKEKGYTIVSAAFGNDKTLRSGGLRKLASDTAYAEILLENEESKLDERPLKQVSKFFFDRLCAKKPGDVFTSFEGGVILGVNSYCLDPWTRIFDRKVLVNAGAQLHAPQPKGNNFNYDCVAQRALKCAGVIEVPKGSEPFLEYQVKMEIPRDFEIPPKDRPIPTEFVSATRVITGQDLDMVCFNVTIPKLLEESMRAQCRCVQKARAKADPPEWRVVRDSCMNWGNGQPLCYEKGKPLWPTTPHTSIKGVSEPESWWE